MPRSISEFTHSLRQLGEIQVNDWDFMELLNKDLKEFEIGPSLRKLGNLKVTNWDFRTVIPAVQKLAHQEVDVVGLMKQAARYKVMEWDFRSTPQNDTKARPPKTLGPDAEPPGGEETQALITRLTGFLQFTAASLVDEPDQIRVRAREIQPGVLRFRLVVSPHDVKDLIGRNGHTATAIRNLLKSTATSNGTHALLEILSHDEEPELDRREKEAG